MDQDGDKFTDEKAEMAATDAERRKARKERCGIWMFHPECIQPLASVYLFIGVLLVFSLVHGVQGMMMVAILTTLEKRFQFPSAYTGMLVSVGILANIFVILFVSHFGSRSHIPRIFCVASLITATGGFMNIIPHLLFGSGKDDMLMFAYNGTEDPHESHIAHQKIQHCEPNSTYGLCTEGSGQQELGFNAVAYAIFLCAEILHGLAGTPFWTLGMLFIDENLARRTASRVTGVYLGVRFVSPVLSFALSALFLNIYVDLSPTDMDPSHPQWIGAWWIGYLLCGISALCCAIPLALFPKHFPRKEDIKTAVDEIKEHLELEDAEKNPMAMMEELKIERSEEGILKELPRALGRLFTNSVFVLIIITTAVDCFQFGFISFLPKYIEVQFQQTAWIANILGGLCIGVIGGINSPLSGYIASKMKISTPATNTRLCALFCGISALAFSVLLAFGCSEVPMAGTRGANGINVSMPCNMDCGCSLQIYNPVCGSDGQVYFSECHAGCKPMQHQSNSTILDDCACVPGGSTERGMCGSDCNMMVPYVVFMLTAFFMADLYSVPLYNSIMRSVLPGDRAAALSVFSILIGVGFVPGPSLFGLLADSACILPQTDDCGHPTGACLVYDRSTFRFSIHGLTIVIKGIAFSLFLATWLRARWVENKKKNMKVDGKDAMEPLQGMNGTDKDAEGV